MVTIRTSFSRGMVLLLLIFAAKTGYDYYRVLAWRQTSATVISTRQICEYAKKSGGRGYTREYPLCDDGEEVTRLTGEGYKLRDGRRLRIEALYEAEPGKKTTVTLEPWLENAGHIKSGSTIEIRVSSGSAELAILPNPAWTLLLAIFVALIGAHAYFARRRATP